MAAVRRSISQRPITAVALPPRKSWELLRRSTLPRIAIAEIIEFDDAGAAGPSYSSVLLVVEPPVFSEKLLAFAPCEDSRGGRRASADRHSISAPIPISTTGQRSRKATRNIPRFPKRKRPPITTQKMPALSP